MATTHELEEMNARFQTKCVAGVNVFRVKNHQYDNTIEFTGVLGAAVELIGAIVRLRALVLRIPENERFSERNIKALENVGVDIHNYANILLLMLEDKNWSGK
jgi:hypothetical protein